MFDSVNNNKIDGLLSKRPIQQEHFSVIAMWS